jgi:hypothetical protein
MKAQQLHRKHVASAILNSVNPETFVPTRLTIKAMNQDSCWDEYDADMDDAIPDYLTADIEDLDY